MQKHRRRHLLAMLTGAASLVIAGAGVGTMVLLSGALTTAATKQHFRVTHRILDLGLEYSVLASSEEIAVPALDDPGQWSRGAACYQQHCVACHGAPGVAPDAFALGMLPVPANLAFTASANPPEWLYYVTRKGVRMTGMPAWEYRLSDDSLWSVVAFLERLPGLHAQGYQELLAAAASTRCEPSRALPVPVDGDVLLRQYGCHSCHRIEGVVGPRVDAAPPLVDWHRRAYIGGVLPNTERNLARWIADPRAISPQTLMPDLGVPPEHARAMARFLFTSQ